MDYSTSNTLEDYNESHNLTSRAHVLNSGDYKDANVTSLTQNESDQSQHTATKISRISKIYHNVSFFSVLFDLVAYFYRLIKMFITSKCK